VNGASKEISELLQKAQTEINKIEELTQKEKKRVLTKEETLVQICK
jgi:uncharacterized protein YnzC (UPF0291/DUF896 family)